MPDEETLGQAVAGMEAEAAGEAEAQAETVALALALEEADSLPLALEKAEGLREEDAQATLVWVSCAEGLSVPLPLALAVAAGDRVPAPRDGDASTVPEAPALLLAAAAVEEACTEGEGSPVGEPMGVGEELAHTVAMPLREALPLALSCSDSVAQVLTLPKSEAEGSALAEALDESVAAAVTEAQPDTLAVPRPVLDSEALPLPLCEISDVAVVNTLGAGESEAKVKDGEPTGLPLTNGEADGEEDTVIVSKGLIDKLGEAER